MEKLGRGPVVGAPQLISTRQLAEGLLLPVRSVYQLAREGRIPGVIRIGRRIRFDAAVIADWLRAPRGGRRSRSALRSR